MSYETTLNNLDKTRVYRVMNGDFSGATICHSSYFVYPSDPPSNDDPYGIFSLPYDYPSCVGAIPVESLGSISSIPLVTIVNDVSCSGYVLGELRNKFTKAPSWLLLSKMDIRFDMFCIMSAWVGIVAVCLVREDFSLSVITKSWDEIIQEKMDIDTPTKYRKGNYWLDIAELDRNTLYRQDNGDFIASQYLIEDMHQKDLPLETNATIAVVESKTGEEVSCIYPVGNDYNFIFTGQPSLIDRISPTTTNGDFIRVRCLANGVISIQKVTSLKWAWINK